MTSLKEFGTKAGAAFGALIVSASIATKAEAAIVVLDFEQFASLQAGQAVFNIAPIVQEDGFTLTTDNQANLPFRSFGDQTLANTGSVALTPGSVGNITTLTQDNGVSFGALSIDLEKFGPSEPTSSFTFIGEKSNGGTVSQTFNLVGLPDFVIDTYTFDSVFNDDLVSLHWQEGDSLAEVAQFDNIVLQNNSVVQAPLPGAALFMGSALLGLAGLSLRRDK